MNLLNASSPMTSLRDTMAVILRDPWFQLIIVFGIVIKLFIFFSFCAYLPLNGDERGYVKRAVLLIQLCQSLPGNADYLLLNKITGSGFFMPGMSVVLLPVVFFTQDPYWLRIYIGLLNFSLFVFTAVYCYHWFGRKAALFYMLLLAVWPGYLFFSFTCWGETLAGALLMFILFQLWRTMGRLVAGKIPSKPEGMRYGLLLIILLYLRPSLVVFIPCVLALFIAAGFVSRLSREKWRQLFVSLLMLTAVIVTLLAPWSYLLSKKHGGFYPTTTTIGLSRIVLYGDKENSSTVDRPGLGWSRVYRNIWMQAKAKGISYHQEAKEQQRLALSNLTVETYGQTAIAMSKRFYWYPNFFLDRFERLINKTRSAQGLQKIDLTLVKHWNGLLWIAVLAGIALLFCFPWPLTDTAVWPGLLGKIAVLSVIVQPLLANANARHIVVLFPIFASLLAVTLTCGRRHKCIQGFLHLETRAKIFSAACFPVGLFISANIIMVGILFLAERL